MSNDVTNLDLSLCNSPHSHLTVPYDMQFYYRDKAILLIFKSTNKCKVNYKFSIHKFSN